MPQSSLLTFFQPTSAESNAAVLPYNGNVSQTNSQPTFRLEMEEENSESSVSRPKHESILDQLLLSDSETSRSDLVMLTHCPGVIICKVQPYHLQAIKQLNRTLLPVRYPDKFFDDCIHDLSLARLARVAIHDSKPVGWIRCRFEAGNNDTQVLYIQAIGVLAPWRGLGLATALLEEVSKADMMKQYQVTRIYAHVWQNNEDALEWYVKRGFTRSRLDANYYRRLKPAGAWVMYKSLKSE